IPAPKTSRILPLSHSPDGAAADSADGTAGAAGSLLPQAWGARDRVRVLFLLRQGTAGRPVPQPPRQKARHPEACCASFLFQRLNAPRDRPPHVLGLVPRIKL